MPNIYSESQVQTLLNRKEEFIRLKHFLSNEEMFKTMCLLYNAPDIHEHIYNRGAHDKSIDKILHVLSSNSLNFNGVSEFESNATNVQDGLKLRFFRHIQKVVHYLNTYLEIIESELAINDIQLEYPDMLKDINAFIAGDPLPVSLIEQLNNPNVLSQYIEVFPRIIWNHAMSLPGIRDAQIPKDTMEQGLKLFGRMFKHILNLSDESVFNIMSVLSLKNVVSNTRKILGLEYGNVHLITFKCIQLMGVHELYSKDIDKLESIMMHYRELKRNQYKDSEVTNASRLSDVESYRLQQVIAYLENASDSCIIHTVKADPVLLDYLMKYSTKLISSPEDTDKPDMSVYLELYIDIMAVRFGEAVLYEHVPEVNSSSDNTFDELTLKMKPLIIASLKKVYSNSLELSL